MQTRKFKPLIDRLYTIILLSTIALLAVVTTIVCIYPAPVAIFIITTTDLICIYFFITSLFGYVELRENSLFIKYGLILKKEIPYDKIRGTVKERKLYSDSLLSLKNAIEHINIKYNTFDITTVSVVDNDTFIKELEARIINRQFSN